MITSDVELVSIEKTELCTHYSARSAIDVNHDRRLGWIIAFVTCRCINKFDTEFFRGPISAMYVPEHM